MKRLSIAQTEGQLIVTRSREVARHELIIALVGSSIVVITLLTFLYFRCGIHFLADRLAVTILLGTVVVFFFICGWPLWRRWRVALHGETFTFDRVTNRFLHNARTISPLSQLEQVVVHEKVGGDGELLGVYYLYITLRNGKRIVIENALESLNEVSDVAQEIGAYLGCVVSRKIYEQGDEKIGKPSGPEGTEKPVPS